MLVLTRKIGEEIVIGDTIHIKIVGIDGRKVRIGVVAPKDMIVDRQEVRELRLGTNKEANYVTCEPAEATTPLFISKELNKLPPIASKWQSIK